MQVLFGRSHTLGSAIVRLGTWSNWGHCGLVTPDGTVIEALALQGVTERPLRAAVAMMTAYDIVDVPTPNDAAGLEWARGQLGRPYDWAGVFGLAIRREWERDDAWFCSELVEAAIARAGRPRWRSIRRVTPQHTWMAA